MNKAKLEKGEKIIELEAKIPYDVTIAYWYDRKLPGNEMPESEQEHIIEALEKGYVEGELNYGMSDGKTENGGWWRIVSKSKSF